MCIYNISITNDYRTYNNNIEVNNHDERLVY